MPNGLGAFFNTNGSASRITGCAYLTPAVATLIYLPSWWWLTAQNAIEQEESEEDIANALKF